MTGYDWMPNKYKIIIIILMIIQFCSWMHCNDDDVDDENDNSVAIGSSYQLGSTWDRIAKIEPQSGQLKTRV